MRGSTGLRVVACALWMSIGLVGQVRAQTTFSYSGPAVLIPDNNPLGTNFTVPVSGAGRIANLDVRFDTGGACSAVVGDTNAAVDHTFIGNLIFELTPPGGSSPISFWARRGGTRENICLTRLSNQGNLPNISTLTSTTGSPATGNFAPEVNGALSAFNGINANGNWTLNVSDNASNNTGSLRRFSLIITPLAACPLCTDQIGNLGTAPPGGTTGTLATRLFRPGTPSANCAGVVPPEPLNTGTGPFIYNAHTYTNTLGTNACFQFTLVPLASGTATSHIQFAAFRGDFVSVDISSVDRLLGDPGASSSPLSGPTTTHSFQIPLVAGQTISLVVFNVEPAPQGSNAGYLIETTPNVPANPFRPGTLHADGFDGPPEITSPNTLSLIGGQTTNLPFTITTSATPNVNSITQGGTLPAGLTFSHAAAASTAQLTGAPINGSGSIGPYPVNLGASNGGPLAGTQTLTITVTDVNVAPTFTKGPDRMAIENASAQSVPNWATAISRGGTWEGAQLVNFQITANSNPGLFSAAPAVSPTGTLTFTPAANVNGTAAITLVLRDNGGTLNGGMDTSAPQTFNIHVTPTPMPGTVSYTGPAVPIPDNTPAGVNIILPVAGVGTVADLNFRFDTGGVCDGTPGNTNAGVDHTFVGDLTFKLTSPGGTTVTFMARRGGTHENICLMNINDEGGFPSVATILNVSGSISGNFAPETTGMLNGFDAQNANGIWVLNVSDNAGLDTGSMRRFSLVFNSGN
jgi:subtilisin-like proprotein convertase family protein